MWRSPEPRFDVASAICQGGRDYQEDAIVTDFPFGADSGVVVLADGMGGHAAGDVASKIVVTEVFSELKFESANFSDFEGEIPRFLTEAAANANSYVREHVQAHPETRGMGATLAAAVMTSAAVAAAARRDMTIVGATAMAVVPAMRRAPDILAI